MKCVCGYEKLGYRIDDNGKYRNFDPEKQDFTQLKINGQIPSNNCDGFKLAIITLYVCPECSTIKYDD